MNILQSILYVLRNSFVNSNRKIKGEGNIICVPKRVTIDLIGNNNCITIDSTEIHHLHIYVRANNSCIKKDKDCVIGDCLIWLEDDWGIVRIGEYTTIESAKLACTETKSEIKIGKDCMISTNVVIRTGDSHTIYDIPSKKRINYALDVNIADHVWIGDGAVILKGVNIGVNSVIGSHSLCTRDVPRCCVAAGVPCKVIRENTNWIRKRVYGEMIDNEMIDNEN